MAKTTKTKPAKVVKVPRRSLIGTEHVGDCVKVGQTGKTFFVQGNGGELTLTELPVNLRDIL